MNAVTILILILSFAAATHTTKQALQFFYGDVGAGNYSYYKLAIDGHVHLILVTLEGDADIYVSQRTISPTFDLENHCLQSVTCGIDSVEIPSEFRRPVGIGIYGHPSHELSSYELQVYIDDNYQSDNYFYTEESENGNKMNNFMPPIHSEEKESPLWTILVGILKILLEILT